MAKQTWRGGNMLYPLPVVLVSVSSPEEGDNVLTVAWAGTVCSDPAMLSISVRKERYSHKHLMQTGTFVVNLTTEALLRATDYCGVVSGRKTDKFRDMNLHKEKATYVDAPLIQESPVNLECRVKQVIELGSHDVFLAEILAVHVDEAYLDEKGAFHLEKALPIVYNHGSYHGIKECIGTFGFSVRKKRKEQS